MRLIHVAWNHNGSRSLITGHQGVFFCIIYLRLSFAFVFLLISETLFSPTFFGVLFFTFPPNDLTPSATILQTKHLWELSRSHKGEPEPLLFIYLWEIGSANSASRWIASYLAGRKQAIPKKCCVRNCFTTHRFPQNSTLGILLFMLHISNGFHKDFNHLINAENLQLPLD